MTWKPVSRISLRNGIRARMVSYILQKCCRRVIGMFGGTAHGSMNGRQKFITELRGPAAHIAWGCCRFREKQTWQRCTRGLFPSGTQQKTRFKSRQIIPGSLIKKCGGFVTRGMNGKRPLPAEPTDVLAQFAVDELCSLGLMI